MSSHFAYPEGFSIDGSVIARARGSLVRALYPIRWLVALTAGVFVVVVFVFALSYVRTGEFGISSDLGSSSLQSDLDELVLDATNLFAVDQATVLSTAEGELDRAAQILLDEPALEVAVVGHARVEGNEEFDNVRLSERRALFVIEELVARGVKFERLIPVAIGSEESRTTAWAGEEFLRDQRIELVVVMPG